MCKIFEDMLREEREEAISEGIKESARTAARRMLADGSVPLEKIAEYVDLPLNEIKSLQAEQSA